LLAEGGAKKRKEGEKRGEKRIDLVQDWIKTEGRGTRGNN